MCGRCLRKERSSMSNFIFLKLSDDIYENLLKNKIYIKKIVYNNENWYRITVGTKEENDALIKVIRDLKTRLGEKI